MGGILSSLLLDTHVLYWLTAAPGELSGVARRAIDEADELGVAAITWYEFAWLAEHDRFRTDRPLREWIAELAQSFRTIVLTPSIGTTAGGLPDAIGGDPVDRLIYATALETGMRLVTKDHRLRRFKGPRDICVW